MPLFNRRIQVEALQATAANRQQLFDLLGTKGVKYHVAVDPINNKTTLFLELRQGMIRVTAGDYLIRDGKSFSVMSQEDFEASFDPV